MFQRTLIPPTSWLPPHPPNSTKASCLFHLVFYSFEICRRSNKVSVLAVSCKQRAKYNVSCKVFGQFNMQDCETRVQGSEIGDCVLPQLCASPAQSLLLCPVAFPYLELLPRSHWVFPNHQCWLFARRSETAITEWERWVLSWVNRF